MKEKSMRKTENENKKKNKNKKNLTPQVHI